MNLYELLDFLCVKAAVPDSYLVGDGQHDTVQFRMCLRLALALSSTTSLSSLSLSGAGFSTPTCIAIAEALKVNTTLQDFWIRFSGSSNVGSESVVAMAES